LVGDVGLVLGVELEEALGVGLDVEPELEAELEIELEEVVERSEAWKLIWNIGAKIAYVEIGVEETVVGTLNRKEVLLVPCEPHVTIGKLVEIACDRQVCTLDTPVTAQK
jgi:hypothetical protein